MPLYICELCNFKSSLKGNYNSHLNTLKHRRNNGEIIRNKVINFKCEHKVSTNEHKVSTNEHKCPKSEHKVSTNEHKVSTNEHKVSTNEHKFQKNNEKNNKKSTCINSPFQKIAKFSGNFVDSGNLKNNSIQKKTDIICEFCSKKFSSKPNLKRHKKLYCKKIKNETNETYIKKIKEMEKRHEQEKNELYKKLEKLIDKVGNTTNNITNTQNIILNNYGNEDMSHISDNLKNQLLTIPYAMIPKMIEAVHFNKNKPENKNIVLPNKNDNKLKIYKDNKWVYKSKMDTINDLVDGKYCILDSHYDLAINNNKELSPFVKMNYLKFRKFYDEGDKELLEQIKKECELVLLNNR